jgi:hypothetical protein
MAGIVDGEFSENCFFQTHAGYVCNELNIRVAEAGRSDWNLIFRRSGTVERDKLNELMELDNVDLTDLEDRVMWKLIREVHN